MSGPNNALEPTAYSFGSAALHLRFRRRLTAGVRRPPFTSVINLCLQGEERDIHDRDQYP